MQSLLVADCKASSRWLRMREASLVYKAPQGLAPPRLTNKLPTLSFDKCHTPSNAETHVHIMTLCAIFIASSTEIARHLHLQTVLAKSLASLCVFMGRMHSKQEQTSKASSPSSIYPAPAQEESEPDALRVSTASRKPASTFRTLSQLPFTAWLSLSSCSLVLGASGSTQPELLLCGALHE